MKRPFASVCASTPSKLTRPWRHGCPSNSTSPLTCPGCVRAMSRSSWRTSPSPARQARQLQLRCGLPPPLAMSRQYQSDNLQSPAGTPSNRKLPSPADAQPDGVTQRQPPARAADLGEPQPRRARSHPGVQVDVRPDAARMAAASRPQQVEHRAREQPAAHRSAAHHPEHQLAAARRQHDTVLQQRRVAGPERAHSRRSRPADRAAPQCRRRRSPPRRRRRRHGAGRPAREGLLAATRSGNRAAAPHRTRCAAAARLLCATGAPSGSRSCHAQRCRRREYEGAARRRPAGPTRPAHSCHVPDPPQARPRGSGPAADRARPARRRAGVRAPAMATACSAVASDRPSRAAKCVTGAPPASTTNIRASAGPSTTSFTSRVPHAYFGSVSGRR